MEICKLCLPDALNNLCSMVEWHNDSPFVVWGNNLREQDTTPTSNQCALQFSFAELS